MRLARVALAFFAATLSRLLPGRSFAPLFTGLSEIRDQLNGHGAIRHAFKEAPVIFRGSKASCVAAIVSLVSDPRGWVIRRESWLCLLHRAPGWARLWVALKEI